MARTPSTSRRASSPSTTTPSPTSATSPTAPSSSRRSSRPPSRPRLGGEQLAAPALDGLGDLPEGPAPRRQLVEDPHRRAGLDQAQHDAARLQLLQPRREGLVTDAAGPLAQLAEAQ